MIGLLIVRWLSELRSIKYKAKECLSKGNRVMTPSDILEHATP